MLTLVVYSSVYRLDLKTFVWSLVTPLPNTPPPPQKRCGHSAALWRGHLILIYGGETDIRTYPNDLHAFNVRTHTWHHYHPRGQPPEPRSRAAVCLVGDLLYVSGGTNENGKVLDDLAVLDLGRMIWRRGLRFECRYDHIAFHWDDRIFIYGGLTESMTRSDKVISLHLPSSTKTTTWMQGGNVPSAGGDGHFYYPVTRGGAGGPMLLDFVMPVFRSSNSRRQNNSSVSALDLRRMHWVVLESSPVVRDFVWENLISGNCNGDNCGKAYFIGYPGGVAPNDVFSNVLEVDLSNYGIMVGSNSDGMDDVAPTEEFSGLGGIAKDFATLLDDEESADFQIITDFDPPDDDDNDETSEGPSRSVVGLSASQITDLVTTDEEEESRPVIHCHTLILRNRWPHFRRLLSAKMLEYHTQKLLLPEPYTTTKSLLYYLYTDSIPPELAVTVVARLLVLSNLYSLQHLRTLCLGRLLRSLTVEHATTVWAAAREADERGLERRAGKVCFENWGEVVRTRAFREMKREDVLELCGLVGRGARVVDPSAAGSEGEGGSDGEGGRSDSEIEEDEEGEEGEEGEGTENEEMEY